MDTMPPGRPLALAALCAALCVAAPPARAQNGRASGTSMQGLAHEVAADFGNRAAIAAHDGHILEAEALYRRAVEADAGYLPGYLGYARLLVSRGHSDEALHVLDAIPRRAYELDADAVEVARVRALAGDLDGALATLGARVESPEAARARAQLASDAGRFPEALLAARHLLDIVRDTRESRQAELLVRALTMLVGGADPVASPGPGANALRRLLAE